MSTSFFRAFWFQHFLGQRFQWYRRWYGGRWERHFIDICRSFLWLPMSSDRARQWPAYRQPCSVGSPLIEDYPVKVADASRQAQEAGDVR